MKRYNKYKPSGIEWLGDIPEHWDVKRIKDFAYTQSGTTPNSSNVHYYENGLFNWVRTTDLNDGDLYEVEYKITELALEECRLSFLPIDTVLIAMYGGFGTIGKNSILKVPSTINQSVCAVLPSNKYVSRYFLYFLKYFRYDWKLFADGARKDPNINQDAVKNLFLYFPPYSEQTTIANYLDTKTAAIDRKIELLTAKADKYKALRRSLINETVCRGLNPNAPLKDSGIEWIGMIPAHWEVKRVKDEINIINGFAFDSESYLDSGLPIIRIGDISNEIDFNEVKFISKENAIQAKYSRIKKYDILMAMTGATIGKNSYFQSDRVAYLNQRVCSFRVQNDSIPSFVKYYIESRFIQDLILLVSGGSAQDNISKYQLENFYIIIPPKNEQVEIANYLDNKATKIDTILTNISEQITKLTQLRKTLINDVVTGKIKVTEVDIRSAT